MYYGRCEKAYLLVVKDIAVRKLVTHNVARYLTMLIVLNTVKKLKKYVDLDGILYFDQGFHCTNTECQKVLKNNNVIQSMSRNGNCIYNAPNESFN